MIKVEKRTWSKDKGYNTKIYRLEENKEMQLIKKDGSIYMTQISEFQIEKADWNCDNDIYELYGAYFDINGYPSFFTPENIISTMIEEDCEIVYKK